MIRVNAYQTCYKWANGLKSSTGDLPNVMRCAIWYHLYNLNDVKSTHGGVLLLVKSQSKACNFTKSKTPPLVFYTFFKLYKWYQIAQSITESELVSGNVFQMIFNSRFLQKGRPPVTSPSKKS